MKRKGFIGSLVAMALAPFLPRAKARTWDAPIPPPVPDLTGVVRLEAMGMTVVCFSNLKSVAGQFQFVDCADLERVEIPAKFKDVDIQIENCPNFKGITWV